MKHLLVSIGLIAVLWIVAFVVAGIVLDGGLRPIHQVALIGGMWIVGLVVGFFRFNPDGEFSWYVVMAGITLAAAALFVGIAAPLAVSGASPDHAGLTALVRRSDTGSHPFRVPLGDVPRALDA